MNESMREAFERIKDLEVDSLPEGQGFDAVAIWPELFVGMGERQRNGIRQAVAANWHDGWQPSRDAVSDLVARSRGEITIEEFIERSRCRAEASQMVGGARQSSGRGWVYEEVPFDD